MKLKPLPTNRIAEVRAAHGLTQQQLADKVGSHWITISKLERGKTRLTDEWLIKIAEALDVDEFALRPKDRVLTTVSIEGELFPDGEISPYDENDPHTYTIFNSLFHTEGLIWLYANKTSLEPLFRDGDVLAFRRAAGITPENLQGRLCLCRAFQKGDRTGKDVVGYVDGEGPNSYRITQLGGGIIEKAAIPFIAPLLMAIADLDRIFGDGLQQLPDGTIIDEAED